MGEYVLVVHSRPVAGKEAEYNDWYNNQHLKDVALSVNRHEAGRRNAGCFSPLCRFLSYANG